MPFRLLVAPGVTVNRWALLWSERQPDVDLVVVPGIVLDGDLDAGLVRLPVDAASFHAIPLYTEVTVVVVPKDHMFAAAEELTMADLAGEPVLRPLDDVLGPIGTVAADLVAADLVALDRPPTTADAVELVAAEVGVLVVPQSLARLHHRRDLIYRPVTDAPTSSVGLAWRRDGHTDLVEELIGIVRGRTANSTRGVSQLPPAPAPARRGGQAPRDKRGGAPARRRGR